MIQLLPIFLVAVVIAADAGFAAPGFGGWVSLAVAFGPVLLELLTLGVITRSCKNRMALGQVPGPVIFADKSMRWGLVAIIITHGVSVLAFGWLNDIRSVTGNLIIIDEFLAMTPALIGILGSWWLYYPIERRLREALLIRRLDDGVPVYPVPGRARYVLTQARLHLLLLLVPILLILTLDEVIEWAMTFAPRRFQSSVLADMLTMAGGLCVFVFAPLIARIVLSLKRIPDGPLRSDLVDICRRHRVKVNDILLWGTSGTMINAAVMGLTRRLRYVMISDALIESMPRKQVLAVMAHEIGHVKRHHMPWLLLSLLALLAGAEAVMSGGRWLAARSGLAEAAWPPNANQPWFEGIWMVLTLIPALWVFGWVSRRFERQADTFAVQHLSGLGADDNEPAMASGCDDGEVSVAVEEQTPDDLDRADLPNPTPGLISHAATGAMIRALNLVSRLNHVNPGRHSWRHGSIAWRTSYLKNLTEEPMDELPIDRQVWWIKSVCGIMLAAFAGYLVWAEWSAIAATIDTMREGSG